GRHAPLQLAPGDGAGRRDRLRRGPRAGPSPRARSLPGVMGGGRTNPAGLSGVAREAQCHWPVADHGVRGSADRGRRLAHVTRTFPERALYEERLDLGRGRNQPLTLRVADERGERGAVGLQSIGPRIGTEDLLLLLDEILH